MGVSLPFAASLISGCWGFCRALACARLRRDASSRLRRARGDQEYGCLATTDSRPVKQGAHQPRLLRLTPSTLLHAAIFFVLLQPPTRTQECHGPILQKSRCIRFQRPSAIVSQSVSQLYEFQVTGFPVAAVTATLVLVFMVVI